MEWLVVALVVIVLLATWITWTAMRIDRLAARCDAAWLRLDSALVRRSAALRAVVDEDRTLVGTAAADGIRALVRSANDADREQRSPAENAISACISDLPTIEARAAASTAGLAGPSTSTLAELAEACDRVHVARTFYNDAVRASLALRAQRIPRWFRLGRAGGVPEYFDIDDGAGVSAYVHP